MLTRLALLTYKSKYSLSQILIEVNYCNAFACKHFFFVAFVFLPFACSYSVLLVCWERERERERIRKRERMSSYHFKWIERGAIRILALQWTNVFDTIRCVKIILIDTWDNANANQSMKCSVTSKVWKWKYLRNAQQQHGKWSANDSFELIK